MTGLSKARPEPALTPAQRAGAIRVVLEACAGLGLDITSISSDYRGRKIQVQPKSLGAAEYPPITQARELLAALGAPEQRQWDFPDGNRFSTLTGALTHDGHTFDVVVYAELDLDGGAR